MDDNYYIWKDFARWWKTITAPKRDSRDNKKYRIHPDTAHYCAPKFPKRLPYLRGR